MKKKVLFITNIPAPYRIDFFNEFGKEVDLTVIYEAKGASDQGIRFNYNLEEIKNFKVIFLDDGNIKERKINWKIIKYLKKNVYDEVFVTNYSYFTEMIAIIFLKLKHIQYYMETDGGIIKNENIIKRLYKKFLVSGAKGYFSPSKKTDEYLEYYGAKKEKIYRYPFTSLRESDILEKTLNKEEKRVYKDKLGVKEDIVILGVGRFIYSKGWDLLLHAAVNLDKNIGIYIVGGKTTIEYQSIKENLNLTNVYFVEFKNKKELNEYYKAADVFVLPTRGDVWGLVINEALSCGLPTITTDACIAGLELIKDGYNGYLIKNEDFEELRDKLIYLSKNDEVRNNMASNALKQIEKYSIENEAKKHINILNNNK